MFQANINVFEVDFGMVKRFLSEVLVADYEI